MSHANRREEKVQPVTDGSPEDAGDGLGVVACRNGGPEEGQGVEGVRGGEDEVRHALLPPAQPVRVLVSEAALAGDLTRRSESEGLAFVTWYT